MKWLIGCLLALIVVTTAMAGEDPYVAVVDNDIFANSFYLSPKYVQFAYDQDLFDVPVCYGTFPAKYRTYGDGCEQFRSQTPVNQPEVCDISGVVNGVGDFTYFGEPNARVTAGNSGWYEWYVRLPKKPSGEINLCIQCGILKPNSFAIYEFDAIELCAAETGEKIATGCSRAEVDPGVNPIVPTALPQITAVAYPGPYASADWVKPFKLTAFKNPSNYALTQDGGALQNSKSLQILDGSIDARILLKACMDKCLLVKIPVTGQVNAAGETETDLEAGDLIGVRMVVPRAGTVDVYCHAQSLRVMGIGEAPY